MKAFIIFEVIAVSIATLLMATEPSNTKTEEEVYTSCVVTTEEPTVTTEEITEPETSITETEPVETTVEETTEEITETEPVITEPPEPELYIELTDEEKRILATLIRLECGGSSYECQMAVGSVVLNRMSLFGQSLTDVVFQKNLFSPAHLINRKWPGTDEYIYKPYDKNWQVVEDLCKDGPTLPYYVIYFRAGYHHPWATPYCVIDTTYFSYSEKYK